MTFKWPSDFAGKRFAVDERGIVDRLADDAAVEIWVCFRLDEPWTWAVKSGQHLEDCAHCGTTIVVMVTAKSPTNPGVLKLCVHCAERLAQQKATVQ